MLPVDVHIHTNTSCNLNCKHCYENNGNLPPASINEELEIALIRYLSTNFDADIHLEGGEIFLEEEKISVLNRLDKSALRRITITTNGTYRTQKDDVLCVLRNIAALRISVEGHTGLLHNMLRDGDLQTVLNNAVYYRQNDIKVALRITLNSQNMSGMFSNTIVALEATGVTQFDIYEIQPVGSGKTSKLCIDGLLDVFFNDWIAAPLNAAVKVALPLRRLKEIGVYKQALTHAGVNIKEVGKCANVSISADGAVRICPWDMVSEPLMFVNLKNIEALKEVINAQHMPHECAYCSRIVMRGGLKC